MVMDESLRIMMLKISLYIGLLSLLINKLTIAILLSMYIEVGIAFLKIIIVLS